MGSLRDAVDCALTLRRPVRQPIQGSTLEVKTRAPNGVVFRTLGVRDNKTDHILGEVEIKHQPSKAFAT